MRNFIRYWNRNRKKIIIVIAIIAFIFILIRILDGYYKNKSINSSSPVIDMTKPIQSVITGQKVDEEVTDKNMNCIDQFINYENNKEYEKAYSLLTDDCKEEYSNDINTFIKNYCTNVFATKKTYNLELWFNSGDAYTYKIKMYEENMLATGEGNLDKNIEDYITIVKGKDEDKISINGFIRKNNINKSKEVNNIEILIRSKKVYKDYETYNITIRNKTSKDILIGDRKNNKDICLIDKDNIQYSAFLNELSTDSLLLKSGYEKNISINFNKIYDQNRVISKIKFKNIILDSEKYLNNKNNEKIDTLEIGVNLQ